MLTPCERQVLIVFCGADIGGRHNASVCVDEHPQEDHPDRRASALPEAAVEGVHP